jgi:hypothetical protein
VHVAEGATRGFFQRHLLRQALAKTF